MKWVEASNRALDQFNKLLRELECKAGLRGSRPSVVFQQQVNVQIDRASANKEYQK
jgi:hypothetical protein